MPRQPEGLYEWVLGILFVSGAFVIVFDVAKKTIFRGAVWNYDYPAYSFVYNVPATVALVVLTVLFIVAVPRLLSLESRPFVAVLLGGSVVLYGLSFFALPEKSAFHALRPDKAMYCASLEAVNHGVLSYFQQYHEIGHCPSITGFEPAQDRLAYINDGVETLRAWFANAGWFPWHESWTEYAATIGEQKHGPIPPLIAAGAIFIFGQSPGSTVIFNYAAAALLPALTYLTIRELFDEELSRAISLMLVFLPAIFIYVRKHVVAYDTYTAVFTFATIYFFVKGNNERSYLYMAAAGILWSLAILSKLTAIPVAAVLLVVAFTSTTSLIESIQQLTTFAVAALILPLALLAAGYNFIIQYLFQLALHSDLDKGGLFLAQKPQPDLGNPILNFLAATYQYRIMSIPLLMFAFIFLVWAVRNRAVVRRNIRYHYGLAFLVPILPFVLVKYGLNLGRQLLPHFIGIGFLSVGGLTIVVEEASRSRRVLIYRIAILINAALALINL